MNTTLLRLRAALFYAVYGLLTAWFSLSALLLVSWLPFRYRAGYLVLWNRATLRWLTLCCGVRYEVHGLETLPPGPCVILAKHQSQWETFYLQVALLPAVCVLKRELLNVPFFGWGLRLVDPIAIDRDNPKQALRDIQEQGLQRLQTGRRVIIFPEGTRTAPGESGNYARSGAELACRAEVPIVPVAHNAGYCWPSRSFVKYPGTVRVVFGAPIDPRGRSSRELTQEVKEWIEREVVTLGDGRATAAGAPADA